MFEKETKSRLFVFLIHWLILKRPCADVLLQHPFVKKAGQVQELVTLIDNHQKWKVDFARNQTRVADDDGIDVSYDTMRFMTKSILKDNKPNFMKPPRQLLGKG